MSDLQFMPVNEPIAQCEHINLQTHNPLVAGSNPAGPTILLLLYRAILRFAAERCPSEIPLVPILCHLMLGR